MEPNKIDKLFKDKAGQGKFAYNPAHWAEADKLLTASAKTGALSGGIMSAIAVAIVGAAVLLSVISDSTNQKTDFLYEKSASEKNQNATQINAENNVQFDVENLPETKQVFETETKIAATTKAEIIENETLSEGVEKSSSSNKKTNNVVPETKKTSKPETRKTADYTIAAKPEQAFWETQKSISQPENIKIVSILGTSSTLKTGSKTEIVERAEVVEPRPSAFKKSDNFTINLGADYSFLFANRQLQAPNADYVHFRNTYENAENIRCAGLNLQIGYRNWLFNTGVYQTVYNEEINYPSSLWVDEGVDNGSWQVNENWTYHTDTNWVVDSIYSGHWAIDTTWHVAQDSVYTEQWDTVKTEKEDPNLAKNNGTHTLSYVEVPLWFGRSFGRNRLVFDVQGGFAVGFLTATNGARYINTNVDGLLSNEAAAEQFQQVIFSAMLRSGVRFALAPRWEASVYPTLRYSLNSVVKTEGINQKYLGYGLQVGLSYRF